MNALIIISFLLGLLFGVLFLILGFYLYLRYDENRYRRQQAIEILYKKIEVRRILNTHIIELLNRPINSADAALVDPREDVKVPFPDYHFLKNYSSLNNLYIPTYFMDQFFKQLASHLAIFEDEMDLQNGGYIFRDARRLFEDFSISVTDEIERMKKEITRTKNIYPALFKKQTYPQ